MEIVYAGIGARKTPEDVLRKMERAATTMAKLGFTLRSGGAAGADSAFIRGAETGKGNLEIFIPFNRFNGFSFDGEKVLGPPTKEARLLAKKYHPNWPNLGSRGRDFMARNAYQVLGFCLDRPADFILCYTPNGKIVGGTGQALRMANDLNIPILNFGKNTDEYISDFILNISERTTA